MMELSIQQIVVEFKHEVIGEFYPTVTYTCDGITTSYTVDKPIIITEVLELEVSDRVVIVSTTATPISEAEYELISQSANELVIRSLVNNPAPISEGTVLVLSMDMMKSFEIDPIHIVSSFEISGDEVTCITKSGGFDDVFTPTQSSLVEWVVPISLDIKLRRIYTFRH